MSNVVVVGTRDHKSRIEAALGNFAELRTEESRRQLVRTIRIMLLQYHGALLGSTDQKGTSAFDAASNVDEVLVEVESASLEDFPRLADIVRSVLKPLYAQFKRTVTLSIGQVRSLQEWTMQTSFGNVPRFIILEGVEQSNEGARNSLLKLLEEPPEHTFIMLISEFPARLLPTILSRLQRHHVRPFSEAEKNSLLATVFFADGTKYRNLEEYMLERSGVPCKQISAQGSKFVQSILDKAVLPREQLDVLCDELDEPIRLEYFLKELQAIVRQRFLEGALIDREAARLVSIVGEAEQKATVFNQSRKLLVESLHYRLLEVR
jgi:DNA polymerase-3 subunit gamma/tau